MNGAEGFVDVNGAEFSSEGGSSEGKDGKFEIGLSEASSFHEVESEVLLGCLGKNCGPKLSY